MKKIWFYGCSLTAGDELSDKEYFPWKTLDMDVAEYHRKRNEYFSKNIEAEILYQNKNKELSYPKKIENDRFLSINRAENGASLRTMIVKSMSDIFNNEIIDMIVFQIPIFQRELYLYDNYISSIQMSSASLSKKLQTYRDAKIISHASFQQSFEDLHDLILFYSFLKNRNIPNLFIFLNEEEYLHRILDLETTKYDYIIQQFNCIETVLHLYQISIVCHRELGGHLTEESHKETANLIRNQIEKIL